MTVWYVHRRRDGTIASAHQELRPGYAEEVVEDSAPELAAILNPPVARLSRLVIARRLTDAERASVIAMQSGTAQEQAWWLEYMSAVEIDPNDAATVAGFEAVFGAERAAALLAPEA